MLPDETRIFYVNGAVVLAGATRAQCAEIKKVLDEAGIFYETMDSMDVHGMLNLPRINNPQKFSEKTFDNNYGVISMMGGFQIQSLEILGPILPQIVLISSISKEDLDRAFS